MPLYDLVCDRCGWLEEDMLLSVDERNTQECAACGAVMRTQGGGQGILMGGAGGVGRCFPYFDRNLGMEIQSAKHRQQVADARGLVPLDSSGDSGLTSTFRASERLARTREEKLKDHIAQLEADPETRKDWARTQEWAKEYAQEQANARTTRTSADVDPDTGSIVVTAGGGRG